jgi:hypothetical protein
VTLDVERTVEDPEHGDVAVAVDGVGDAKVTVEEDAQ